MDQEKITPPAERVQFILGKSFVIASHSQLTSHLTFSKFAFTLGEDDQDGLHESHPLFSELEELCGDSSDQQWRETARYVFYLPNYNKLK